MPVTLSSYAGSSPAPLNSRPREPWGSHGNGCCRPVGGYLMGESTEPSGWSARPPVYRPGRSVRDVAPPLTVLLPVCGGPVATRLPTGRHHAIHFVPGVPRRRLSPSAHHGNSRQKDIKTALLSMPAGSPALTFVLVGEFHRPRGWEIEQGTTAWQCVPLQLPEQQDYDQHRSTVMEDTMHHPTFSLPALLVPPGGDPVCVCGNDDVSRFRPCDDRGRCVEDSSGGDLSLCGEQMLMRCGNCDLMLCDIRPPGRLEEDFGGAVLVVGPATPQNAAEQANVEAAIVALEPIRAARRRWSPR